MGLGNDFTFPCNYTLQFILIISLNAACPGHTRMCEYLFFKRFLLSYSSWSPQTRRSARALAIAVWRKKPPYRSNLNCISRTCNDPKVTMSFRETCDHCLPNCESFLNNMSVDVLDLASLGAIPNPRNNLFDRPRRQHEEHLPGNDSAYQTQA